MRATSFRSKIFLTVLVATLAALAVPLIYARTVLHGDLLTEARQQALREVHLAARLLDALPANLAPDQYLDELGAGPARFTLLTGKGQVLADTSTQTRDVADLDNHGDRPEFRAALLHKEGLSTRYSNTLGTDMIYAAVALKNGQILRLALPFAGLKARIDGQVKGFSMLAGITALLSMALAFLFSGWLKKQLGQMVQVVEAISLGKYQRRLRHLPGREFAALADAVNRMAANIEDHVRTVADQKEQLQSILDTMNEGVLVLGQQGCIRRCNKALTRMFPAATASHGAQVVEIIPSPALQEAVEELLSVPPSAPTEERSMGPLQLELAPGRVFAVHLARAGLDNLSLGAVAVFHDITEIMRLERIRRDFVANVSHELRTPLTAIQGYAETLADLENAPEDCRRFAEIIHKNGAYLARMVEELLSLARLENADIALPLVPLSPAECARVAVSLCRGVLQARAMDVQMEIAEDLRVLGNAQHLTQVFRNLVENAARYAPEGGLVLLRSAHSQDDADKIRFAVYDDGPGIPGADLTRVFERFYRVEKHRGHASTGLGLAICKHIVERHGGRIWAESPAEGHATALYFTLAAAVGDTQ